MSRTKESVFEVWFAAEELERINHNAPSTLMMSIHNRIFDALRENNPEPLIEFVRKGGDIRKFGDDGLDQIAQAWRGKKLKPPGKPPKEHIRIRNARLCFYVAWFSVIEDHKLTDPRRARNTAFRKAAKAIDVTERTAREAWGKCDKARFRAAVRY